MRTIRIAACVVLCIAVSIAVAAESTESGAFLCPNCGIRFESALDFSNPKFPFDPALIKAAEEADMYSDLMLLAVPIAQCPNCGLSNFWGAFWPVDQDELPKDLLMNAAQVYAKTDEFKAIAKSAPSYYICAKGLEYAMATAPEEEFQNLARHLPPLLGPMYTVAVWQAENSHDLQYQERSLEIAKRYWDVYLGIMRADPSAMNGDLLGFAQKIYSLININRRLGRFEDATSLLPLCQACLEKWDSLSTLPFPKEGEMAPSIWDSDVLHRVLTEQENLIEKKDSETRLPLKDFLVN